MSSANIETTTGSDLADDDIIGLLLEQHGRIRTLFAEVQQASPEDRQARFDELRSLLAVHETAEELLLRPVTQRLGGEAIADERNGEEREANEVLAQLERLDASDPAFLRQLAEFEQAVSDHADSEETDEFPLVIAGCDAQERSELGVRLGRVQSMAPTHPHPSSAGSPSALLLTGPFASMIDRVRDKLTGANTADEAH